MVDRILESSIWFILVADDHGHEKTLGPSSLSPAIPVQYSSIAGSNTLLQKGLARAARLVQPSHITVTLSEDYREFWEPAAWFVRPENRFVTPGRALSPLAVATAVAKIADHSPSNIVVISPACVYVSREWILRAAIHDALNMLPGIPEGVLTLAMLDPEESVDEDYLVLEPTSSRVSGIARRPNGWVARHLREQGALVASGIMIGYAGAFAAHITRQWSGLARELKFVNESASGAAAECEVTTASVPRASRWAIQSLRWLAPALKQRANCVEGCGWNGLHSARAVARMKEYFSTVERFRRAEMTA